MCRTFVAISVWMFVKDMFVELRTHQKLLVTVFGLAFEWLESQMRSLMYDKSRFPDKLFVTLVPIATIPECRDDRSVIYVIFSRYITIIYPLGLVI